MLKTKVKANSVTNLTDARYFAAREVEWLGFNLEANRENYIDPTVMQAIKEWVDGVKIVGEFDQPDLATIQSAMDLLQLDQIQLGPYVDYATLKGASEKAPIIQEIFIEKDTTVDFVLNIIEPNQAFVGYFILNFNKHQISLEDLHANHPISMDDLKEWCEQYAILFDLNFSAANVQTILDEIQPAGICLKGGDEEKVGYKSFDELDDIFDEIEELV